MKKFSIKGVDETVYFEKIDNGLEIYMLPKAMNNIYVTFTTRYGSLHNEFIPRDKKEMVKMPYGIAHFLEHKMFEQENGVDPMLYYASKGADVNASTSRRNTTYEFYGPENIKENINYLLDFVQQPYITDENVEKEKGIIEQEIVMYEDDPYSVAFDAINFNAFKRHSTKYSVAGTVKDVDSITKEQLYTCYNTFYHPSNMLVVVTGNFNPEETVGIIKENQNSKEFGEPQKIVFNEEKEPNEVEKEYEEKKMGVLIPKLSYGIKVPFPKMKLDKRKRNFYMVMLFDILFGSTSLFAEKAKEQELVDSSFDVYIPYTEEHFLVIINADTRKQTELIEEIKNNLSHIKINEEEFERKKNVLISSQIFLYENIKYTNNYITNNVILYGDVEPDMVQLIKSLNKKELDSFINKLDLSNISILVINPIEKKE